MKKTVSINELHDQMNTLQAQREALRLELVALPYEELMARYDATPKVRCVKQYDFPGTYQAIVDAVYPTGRILNRIAKMEEAAA